EDRDPAGALSQHRITRGHAAVAAQRRPCGHRGARQGRRLLEREMARHGHRGLLADHGVFREHAVEVGAEAVGQIIGLDRAAEPAWVEAADDSIPDRETADAISNSRNFAGAVAERYNPELRRSTTAALQH